ncbi:hypothetical protein HQ545_00650 [Candidatus Woesearchaeota archaeon]|nr:hypothetical protein [Candidatus Woesearchaeota archaeon]
MVKCIKVILKDAQDVKNFLMGERVLDSRYSVRKSGGHILFPVNCKEGVDVLCENFKSAKVVDAILKKRRSNKSFKEQVSSGLSKDEIAALRRAFDIVGSIAIIEVPDELKSKQKLLASTILDLQKNVDTVLKKAGIHGTRFRTQPMTYLTGRRTKETVHREHGVFINLDVEKVYFSPRLSTERMRIAQQVKPGESVLVMFSGCAPYPCVI